MTSTSLPPDSCKVATPEDLAAALVYAMHDSNAATWLEPSHGNGVFLRALSEVGVSRKQITAVDLDAAPGAGDYLASVHRPTDFLVWSATTQARFDRIIGNPPYVSIKRLKGSARETAAAILSPNGKPIGHGANLWYAFILASMRLLRIGGSLGFVLPSAAEFADYSSTLRTSIRASFRSLDVFRCSRSLFDGVQEGTVVAIARGFGEGPGTYRREVFSDRETLTTRLKSDVKLKTVRCPSPTVRRKTGPVRFDSIATIRLGGVTGDANFFLMSDSRREELGIPVEACTPVVSQARQIKGIASMTKPVWDVLKKTGYRIWLLNPSPELIQHPAVGKYLELEENEGGCKRSGYKVANRAPWYQTPLPDCPDAFLSGMSQDGPLLSINHVRKLNASNTLYVVTFRERNHAAWYKWALSMLTTKAQRQIRRTGRRYADGLLKYEPGALGQIELPELKPDLDYRLLYNQALKLSSSRAASALADSCRI